MIKRNFSFLKEDIVVMALFNRQLFRPHLYTMPEVLEKVQRRATRMISSLEGVPYYSQLQLLNLTTLELRRLRGDLIQMKMEREVGHLPFSISDEISSLHWVKIVTVGNTGVGKTCIIKHFCEDKRIVTAFSSVQVLACPKPGAVSVVKLRSSLPVTKQLLGSTMASRSIHTEMLKVDVKGKRTVSREEGMKWAQSRNLRFHETSALSGQGIQNLFQEVIEDVLKKSPKVSPIQPCDYFCVRICSSQRYIEKSGLQNELLTLYEGQRKTLAGAKGQRGSNYCYTQG
ncbi:putative dnaJ-like subfamily C member 27 [Apostichopus japonicus]|uniref:Putative dnaJ-like subfamily C member 27 n=1 Tax=Stichopus japonicus TaxID=307972 RepID=A0A2G8KFP3_STIJA|nr:putative dnaJ-like subfamily C member 27 [Apostichopus japonicus]